MRRFLVLSAFLIILPFQLVYLFVKEDNSAQNFVAGIKTVQSDEVLNWVGIGDYRFVLFGYTSPSAEVYFNGQGISDQTVSSRTGYFEFENRFSPFSPREACLSSKDQFGRISSPVCLPPFPVKYNVSIGPVLIPPTVSLDKNVYYMDDEVVLSGQTIPNSEVNLSVFTKQSKIQDLISKISVVRPVEAFSFPDLTAKSDSKGNFSISLPSARPESFRLFAQTDFNKQESGESVKLNFQIYPVWMIIVRFFLFLIAAIKSRLLEIIIAGEIIYLALAFFKMMEKKNRAIMILPSEEIAIYKEPPVLVKA